MRFRSRLQPRRVGRVVRPASGPHGGRSPSCPAFCDTPPEPDESTLPGCGRRPRIVLLNFVAGAATARQCAWCGSSAADGSAALPPSDDCPESWATRHTPDLMRSPFLCGLRVLWKGPAVILLSFYSAY